MEMTFIKLACASPEDLSKPYFVSRIYLLRKMVISAYTLHITHEAAAFDF